MSNDGLLEKTDEIILQNEIMITQTDSMINQAQIIIDQNNHIQHYSIVSVWLNGFIFGLLVIIIFIMVKNEKDII